MTWLMLGSATFLWKTIGSATWMDDNTVKSRNYESRNNDKSRNNDMRGDDAVMQASITACISASFRCLVIQDGQMTHSDKKWDFM